MAVRATLTGAQIAQAQERYQDALDLCRALSAHPQFAQADLGWLVCVYAGQMLCRRLTRDDLIEQRTYIPRYHGASQVFISFQCIECQRKSEFFIKQEEWDESLLDEEPDNL